MLDLAVEPLLLLFLLHRQQLQQLLLLLLRKRRKSPRRRVMMTWDLVYLIRNLWKPHLFADLGLMTVVAGKFCCVVLLRRFLLVICFCEFLFLRTELSRREYPNGIFIFFGVGVYFHNLTRVNENTL